MSTQKQPERQAPRVLDAGEWLRIDLRAPARNRTVLTTLSVVVVDRDADGAVLDVDLTRLPPSVTGRLLAYASSHSRGGAVSLDVNADWLWIHAGSAPCADRRRFSARLELELDGEVLTAVTVSAFAELSSDNVDL